MIEVSVIIATYNRAACLLRTLESLKRQTCDPAVFEIVAVNNNSTDDTDDVCARFAAEHPALNFRMVHEPKQGLSHARNCGIAASRGAYIVIIDDDEEVNPDFVKEYHAFFSLCPDVAACGGRIVPLYEFPVPKWLSPYAERPIAGQLDLGEDIREFPRKSYPGGGNMGIRRSAVERYGAFNPALGRTGTNPMGGEEKDLFSRLRAGGEKIYYLPDAIIYHIIPESKLTTEYFLRLSRMTGVSERIRSRTEGTYVRRLFAECVKWGGTKVLMLGYLVSGRPIKGWYLIRMRWQITRGLLNI